MSTLANTEEIEPDDYKATIVVLVLFMLLLISIILVFFALIKLGKLYKEVLRKVLEEIISKNFFDVSKNLSFVKCSLPLVICINFIIYFNG